LLMNNNHKIKKIKMSNLKLPPNFYIFYILNVIYDLTISNNINNDLRVDKQMSNYYQVLYYNEKF
jgi:hypothetical protein